MLAIERDDPVPRADAALTAWRRVLLLIVLLGVLATGLSALLAREQPTEALPAFTTRMNGDQRPTGLVDPA